MTPVQKWVLPFASLVCIVLAVALIVQNWHNEVALNLGNQAFTQLSLGAVLLGLFLLGSGTAFFKLWETMQQVRRQVKQAELRKEKAEVTAETTSDQIRALESKVQTLEKALEQALAPASGKKKR